MNYKLHPLMNIFILLVSLGMFIYMSWQLYESIDLKYNSYKAEGTITGYYTMEGDAKFRWNRKPEYAPVFSYNDKDGEKYKIITSTFKKQMKYKKGDIVIVYYNSNNPTKAQIDDSFPWKREVLLWVMGLLGVYFTLIPIQNKKTD